MVARMINLCGFHLGKKKDLMPPLPENADGFWENRRFVAINDELLSQFGGAWDSPPMVAPGWEAEPALRATRAKAAHLIRQFAAHECWMWKDPRNSLTLPFWRQLLPAMHVIICVRSPLEVANSLARRNHFTLVGAFNLWLTYNRAALAATEPAHRIVVHYGSFFSDAHAELRRILALLDQVVSDDELQKATGAVSGSLRHERTRFTDLVEAQPPAGVIELYEEMCLQAGALNQLSSTQGASEDQGLDQGFTDFARGRETGTLEAPSMEKHGETQGPGALRRPLEAIEDARWWRASRPLRWLSQMLHKRHSGAK